MFFKSIVTKTTFSLCIFISFLYFCLPLLVAIGMDIAKLMMDFIDWLSNQEFGHNCILSIRNVLSWVNFMNVMAQDRLLGGSEEHQFFRVSPVLTFVHAACLVYIDGIGSGKSSRFSSWQNDLAVETASLSGTLYYTWDIIFGCVNTG